MKTFLPITALAIAAIWTAGVAPADRPECVVAAEWVEAHRASLPTTLAAFSEHRLAYRRAIYRALDVETRAALWREHIAAVAEQVTQPEQRLFLERTIPAVDGYLSETAPESRLNAFFHEAVAVLGEDLAREAFVRLGPAPQHTLEGGEAQRPDCSCSTQSEAGVDCQEGSKCKSRVLLVIDVCRDLESGCGVFGEEECDGLCFRSGPLIVN